jgi:hypothetical protein
VFSESTIECVSVHTGHCLSSLLYSGTPSRPGNCCGELPSHTESALIPASRAVARTIGLNVEAAGWAAEASSKLPRCLPP